MHYRKSFEDRILCLSRKYSIDVFNTPRPYVTLLGKLMDEASVKYFVGQVISAISYPLWKIWASIWLSKTKSSEFLLKSISNNTFLENARYPVWYSDNF